MFTETTTTTYYPINNILSAELPRESFSIASLIERLENELSELTEINNNITSRICPVMKFPVCRVPNVPQEDCQEMSHVASKLYDLITRVRKESGFITEVSHAIEL